ncbi:MAG: hypothetical protein DMG30_24125 [Acidobacteria bacterium]|nr:MAG: hypothetical protein DMG30_24125 [Acidobacteriota bacterium]
MRASAAIPAWLSLVMMGAMFGVTALADGAIAFASSAASAPRAGVPAKDKPLSWKPIEDALLRVNDAPPKEWEVYRTGKKNEPLLLQIGNRFLLIEAHDRQVFELDPSKIERKTGELLWNPADRSAKPLPTADWVADDIGAAFIIKVKLDNENALVDLQLPHPPDVGSLPQQAPARTRRRDYFMGEE